MRGSTLGVDEVDPLVLGSPVVALPEPVDVVAEPDEVVDPLVLGEPVDVVDPESLGEPDADESLGDDVTEVADPDADVEDADPEADESLGEPEAEEFPGDGGTDAGLVDFDVVGEGVVHGWDGPVGGAPLLFCGDGAWLDGCGLGVRWPAGFAVLLDAVLLDAVLLDAGPSTPTGLPTLPW